MAAVKLSVRDFFNAATSIASGELQGRIAGEQEARNRALQDYNTALTQFQVGHQLEAERRGERQSYDRTALGYLPYVSPDQRAGYGTDFLTDLSKSNSEPQQYGPDQFQGLVQGYQGAHPSRIQLPLPASAMQQPGAMQPPPMQPPAPPQPSGANAPAAPLPAPGGDVLGQPTGTMPPPPSFSSFASAPPPQNPAGGTAPSTPGAGAGAAMGTNALPPQTGGVFEAGQIPGLTGQNPYAGGQIPGLPLPSEVMAQPQPVVPPGSQPPGGIGPVAPGANPPGGVGPVMPISGGAPGTVQAAQAVGAGATAQKLSDFSAGVNHATAAAAGGSGGNAEGTTSPNERGPVPDQNPAPGVNDGGSPVTQATASAPPPPLPPSATIGNAPVVVSAPGPSGASVFHPPGASRDYTFSEIDQKTAGAYQTRYAAALKQLNNSHISDITRAEIARITGGVPAVLQTTSDLQAISRATSELETLGAGLGSSIYGAEQRAAAAGTGEQADVRNVLSIIAKSDKANDPDWVRDLVTKIDGGKIAYLADSLAAGDIGGQEVHKLLQKSLDKIASPGFAKLDPTTQHQYIQGTLGYAERFGEHVDLPADVYLQMTPAEKDIAARGWANIGISEGREKTGERGLALREAEFRAKMSGLIGAGANGRGGLTANAQLAAAREPLQRAYSQLAAYRKQSDMEGERTEYDQAKSNLLRGGKDEVTAIKTILNDPRTSPQNKTMAQYDLNVVLGEQHFQNLAQQLAERSAQGVGGAQPGGYGGPAPSAAASGMKTITVNGRPYTFNPETYAQRLLQIHKAKTIQDAWRQVQILIQQGGG